MITRADLQSLIDGAVAESLTLDYKRSEALSRDPQKRNELAKDVSAFANSAGGRIIYGIPEQGQVPQSLDGGIDKSIVTPEWIEQVLRTNIQPPIDGLLITQIDADQGNNKVFYVIDIPQATSRAPHQSNDKKYYRRYNFQSVPMEDFEVRDVIRRASTPALRMELQFDDGSKQQKIEYPNNPARLGGRPLTDAFALIGILFNDAAQPAEHVIVDLYLHPSLDLYSYSPAELSKGVRLSQPIDRLMNQIRWRFSIPHEMPLFKELPRQLPQPVRFRLDLIHALGQLPMPVPIGFRLRCPGFDVERWGEMLIANSTIVIDFKNQT